MSTNTPRNVTLRQEQIDILFHTTYRAANQVYCGGSKDMDELVALGYMTQVPAPSWYVDGRTYKITWQGRDWLNAYTESHAPL